MGRKINANDILRVVYETYRHMVSEDESNAQKRSPIDYHVSFYAGNFYFNITVSDKKLYNSVSNLRTDLIKMLLFKNDKEEIESLFSKYGKDFVNTKEYKKLFAKYSGYFNLNAQNSKKDGADVNMPNAIVFNTPILHPDTIYDEDGNLNAKSNDIKRIRSLIRNFAKRTGYSITDDDVNDAIKSAFYGVKNMFFKEKIKDIEDDAKRMFFEVCKTIGEDETKRLLRTIQVGSQGMIFDSQLSFLNRLRIISQAEKYDKSGGNQLNTVSYVMTERQWRKSGRKVVDFSYPYYIVVAHKGRHGDKTEDIMAANMGYKKLEEENNYIARKHRNKLVNRTYNRSGFGYHTVYDVQATAPINGYEDEWTVNPALKNNLTGELNDVAKERFEKLNNADYGDQKERTDKLNSLFHTTDYNGVSIIYNAVCAVGNVKQMPNDSNDIKTMIKRSGEIIDELLMKKLNSFKDGGGHIALAKNYQQLVPIGRIIIQSIIGLPMDSAPAIEWTEDHKDVAAALSGAVNSISNSILKKKEELMDANNGKITEMYGDIIYNALKLLNENVRK